MRLRKNFSIKKKFGQFLIYIRIQDSDPDSNPGFESGFGSETGSVTNFRPDPDPKLFFRIRNTALKACKF